MPSLRTALATVHRDRAWWRKVLIGGLWSMTIIGYTVVEGYEIESIDNTRNGFPAPLPRWHDVGSKAVQGMLALAIDFAYFVMPLLLAAIIVLCSVLGLSLAGQVSIVGVLTPLIVLLVGGWLLGVWLTSISPLAKRMYVADGQINQALSRKVLQDALDPLARSIYLRARLQSLIVYLVPIALFAAAITLAGQSGWLVLVVAWLACSALVYTHLIVIQLYDAAAREIQQRRFESFRTRLRSEA